MHRHPSEAKRLAVAPTGKRPAVVRSSSHSCCCSHRCCCCYLLFWSSCCTGCTGLCALGGSQRAAPQRHCPANTSVRLKLFGPHGIERVVPAAGVLSENGMSLYSLHCPLKVRKLSHSCCCCPEAIVSSDLPPLLHPPSKCCSVNDQIMIQPYSASDLNNSNAHIYMANTGHEVHLTGSNIC